MASWSSLMQNADALQLATFGVPAILHPQGKPDITITVIIETPPVEEENIPGSLSGTDTIRLFVRLNTLSVTPQRGDRITLNSVLYDVFDTKTDTVGGMKLKLRRS